MINTIIQFTTDRIAKYRFYLALRKCNRLIRDLSTPHLDLGAGDSSHPNAIGIDLHQNADIRWDLTKGIPAPTNSIALITSDHFLEHLILSDVVFVLSECYRVLIPGGVLRISVPHINPYIEAWMSNDIDFLGSKITDIPLGQEELYATCFDQISWLMLRSGEHQSLFDRESIIHKVNLAGFNQVKIDSFDPSRDFNARFSSIYVEAIK